MPQSRHRKVNKARKRPRVPHSNPGVAGAPESSTNRNLRVGAIILVAVIVLAAVAYVITRRGSQAGNEVTTASGLKYRDLEVGTGASPKMGQSVTVHYIGRLENENGKEFNNSYNMGKPIDFKLGQVIEGWNEGLQTMKVGGKRSLWIPSKLAYGPAGRPPSIPPNSNLYFEIKLLGIR